MRTGKITPIHETARSSRRLQVLGDREVSDSIRKHDDLCVHDTPPVLAGKYPHTFSTLKGPFIQEDTGKN